MGVITVSRFYGSNGAAMARAIAAKLGYRYVDKEIVDAVAQRAGVPLPAVQALDEVGYGWVSSLVHSVLSAFQGSEITQESYVYIASTFIREAAAAGNVVIVGRASQVVLCGRPGVMHANVAAPIEDRVVEIARREGIDASHARARIQYVDTARARYVMKVGKRDWLDPALYDLTVNTHGLSVDSAAEVVIEAAIREGVVEPRRGALRTITAA
jgi:cytidylate kinase